MMQKVNDKNNNNFVFTLSLSTLILSLLKKKKRSIEIHDCIIFARFGLHT